MSFKSIMNRILPGFAKEITSPFFRLLDGYDKFGNLLWRAGDVHGGIDFNFEQ